MLPRADFKRSQRKTWNSLPAPSCRGGGRTRPHPRSRSTGLGDNHMHHYDRAGQGRPNSQYTMWRHHAIETKPRHKARHGDRDFTAYYPTSTPPSSHSSPAAAAHIDTAVLNVQGVGQPSFFRHMGHMGSTHESNHQNQQLPSHD